MRFQAEESGIFRLLMGYLRDKNLFETLNSLQLEIGQAEEELGSDLLYLQRIVLQGRWDDVLLFIRPFKDVIQEQYQKVEYEIHRQQFLEALSWQGGGGHRHALLPWKPTKNVTSDIDGELEVESIAALLRSLERLCPPHDFNSLCLCLTLERLSDNPDYANWTVSQGRLDTFQTIKSIIAPVLEQENERSVTQYSSAHGKDFDSGGSNRGLLSMLAMALAYQAQMQMQTRDSEGRQRLQDSDTKNSVDAVFNGSILILESLSAEGLYKSVPQPPSMVVKGVLTCQRFNSEANENSRDRTVEENNASYRKGGQALRDSNQIPPRLQHPDGTVNDFHASGHRESNSSSAASSSSSPGSREVETGPGISLAVSPPVAKIIVAPPVSWTVDGDSKKKGGSPGDSDLLKVNRRATMLQTKSPRMSSSSQRDRQSFNEVSSGKDIDYTSSDVRAPPSPSGQHSASASVTAANRNRRDTVTNVVGAKAGEVRHGGLLSPRAQSDSRTTLMNSSVLYQAECPLRCVCIFGDQMDSNPKKTAQRTQQPSSSSIVFAVGSNEKSVRVSRVAQNPQGRPPSFDIISEFPEIHRGSVYAVDWRNSPDGPGLLATASNDKAIRIISVGSGIVGPPLKGHTGTIRSVAFQDKNGRDNAAVLASAGAGDNRPRLWDVTTGASLCALSAHSDAVHGLAWLGNQGASDGLLLSGCDKGLIVAHDMRMSNRAWTLALPPHLFDGSKPGICCLTASTLDHSNSASEGIIFAGCTGGFVCVIDASTRSVVAAHRPHTDDVRAIALHGVSPKRAGEVSYGLVTTSFDGLGAVWNVARSDGTVKGAYSFQLEAMLKGHGDKILGVASTARNNVLEVITTGADGKAILWTPRT